MPTETPYFAECADAVDWLRRLPDESIELVITDPPYESLEKHRAIGTTTRLKHSKASSNDWFSIFPNERFPSLFREIYRVLKRDSHFYLFCDQETMFVAKPMAEEAGFRFWKPLIWDKKRIGMGYHYRSRYELILFFEKGKRKLNDLGIPDIIECPRIHRGYPTEKPSEVSRVLVEQSTNSGDIVADPFAGSGSVGVASLQAGRRFLGCDLATAAVETITARLSVHGTSIGRCFLSSEEADEGPRHQLGFGFSEVHGSVATKAARESEPGEEESGASGFRTHRPRTQHSRRAPALRAGDSFRGLRSRKLS